MTSTRRPLTILSLLHLLVWQVALRDESNWHRVREETANGAAGDCGRGWLVQGLGLGRRGSPNSGSNGRLRGAADEEKGLLFPLMLSFTLLYTYIITYYS